MCYIKLKHSFILLFIEWEKITPSLKAFEWKECFQIPIYNNQYQSSFSFHFLLYFLDTKEHFFLDFFFFSSKRLYFDIIEYRTIRTKMSHFYSFFNFFRSYSYEVKENYSALKRDKMKRINRFQTNKWMGHFGTICILKWWKI